MKGRELLQVIHLSPFHHGVGVIILSSSSLRPDEQIYKQWSVKEAFPFEKQKPQLSSNPDVSDSSN